jgi:hypothetical protein
MQGTTKVLPRYYQGTTKVIPGYYQGTTRVRSLASGGSPSVWGKDKLISACREAGYAQNQQFVQVTLSASRGLAMGCRRRDFRPGPGGRGSSEPAWEKGCACAAPVCRRNQFNPLEYTGQKCAPQAGIASCLSNSAEITRPGPSTSGGARSKPVSQWMAW